MSDNRIHIYTCYCCGELAKNMKHTFYTILMKKISSFVKNVEKEDWCVVNSEEAR